MWWRYVQVAAVRVDGESTCALTVSVMRLATTKFVPDFQPNTPSRDDAVSATRASSGPSAHLAARRGVAAPRPVVGGGEFDARCLRTRSDGWCDVGCGALPVACPPPVLLDPIPRSIRRGSGVPPPRARVPRAPARTVVLRQEASSADGALVHSSPTPSGSSIARPSRPRADRTISPSSTFAHHPPRPRTRAGARHGRGALPARRRAPPRPARSPSSSTTATRRWSASRPSRLSSCGSPRRASKRLRLRPGRIRPRLRLATRRARGQGDDGERRARRGPPACTYVLRRADDVDGIIRTTERLACAGAPPPGASRRGEPPRDRRGSHRGRERNR